MLRKLFVGFMVLCMASVAVAKEKFLPCYLETVDGEKMECVAYFSGAKFQYKTDPSAPVVKLKRKQVKFAKFTNEDGSFSIVSGSLPLVTLVQGYNNKFHKASNQGWMYFFSDPRDTPNQPVMYYHVVVVNNGKYSYTQDVYGFFRLADGFGVDVYNPMDFVRSKLFRKIASVYMEDCQDMVEYLSNKDLKIKELAEVIKLLEEYIQCKH